VWIPSQGRGVAHHAEHGYQGRKQQADVQCDGDAHVSGDNHYTVGSLCMRGVECDKSLSKRIWTIR
jgi:hypothetical protein